MCGAFIAIVAIEQTIIMRVFGVGDLSHQRHRSSLFSDYIQNARTHGEKIIPLEMQWIFVPPASLVVFWRRRRRTRADSLRADAMMR